MNKLALQVMQSIRILLDKPISPLTQRQLTDLVRKSIIPHQTLVPLFMGKYRADLITLLLREVELPVAMIRKILGGLRKDVGKYQQNQVNFMFKMGLQGQAMQGYRAEDGIFGPLEESLRRPNQEARERLQWLVCANMEVMRELKEGGIIEQLITSFALHYLKQTIYLASFAALMKQCLSFDCNPQHLLIDPQTKRAILERTLVLLQSTASKPLYPFQNGCLSLIVTILNQQSIIADSILLHNCKKTLQSYLWKKPTRQQARKVVTAVQKAQITIEKQQAGKRQYNYDREDKTQQSSPLLIENVINQVNNYRLNQQYNCSSNRFKSQLKNQVKVTQSQMNPQKSKYSKLEQLLDSCIERKEKGSNIKILPQESRQYIRNEPQIPQVQSRVIAEYENPSHVEEFMESSQSCGVQEFDEFEQVNSLIELAYEYKFQ